METTLHLPTLHILTLASAAAAGSLISAVWEGVILAVCVALCLRLLPGVSAAARSVVWMSVLVVVAVLPFVHHSGLVVNKWHSYGVRVDALWSIALAAVWAFLTLIRAGQLAWSAFHLQGVAQRAAPVSTNATVARLLQGNGRRAELCASDEVDRPSVVGFLSPRILLPPDVLARLQPAELEQIVMHEMEHLRRGDDWTNLFQKLCLTFFPLNPVLLWIERRLCVERELACDDGVLRSTGAAKAYATCLASLAEHRLVRRGVSLALGAWERQSELAQRVHRILDRRDTPMAPFRMAATLGFLLTGVAAGGFALAHSPRLISFSEPAQIAAVAPWKTTLFTTTQRSEQGQAHAVMAKAVMPERPITALPIAAARPVRKRRTAPNQPVGQGWYVLTTWQQVEVAPRATYVLAGFSQEPQQFSYAIATRNGWLVFQL